ncbi:MAG: uroporphyrinogen decarboxylase family protein [Thermoguttaceae bacterium]
MNIAVQESFSPDYRHLLQVLRNQRPQRLPLYEHHIDLPFICKALGRNIALEGKRHEDFVAFYRQVIAFWRDMTYDGFDYEAAICEIFPGHGAILGGAGPIQSRDDFNRYPFDELPTIFWDTYRPHLDAIREALPPGMKAFGGCGYGIFESSEDLVGFEPLCIMQYEDPELFADLFRKIGDLYVTLWSRMIQDYGDIFVFFRMGDDLGHKTSTMLSPRTIRQHILPQYKRVIDLVHQSGKSFLLHSCGCIFDVMEDLVALGIDAKHSNEDQIAPFDRWIADYGDRIGLLGGIDVNTLCLKKPDEVYRETLEKGMRFRAQAKGYGLGSGNSIPEYIPVEGFLAMVEAAKTIRNRDIV